MRPRRGPAAAEHREQRLDVLDPRAIGPTWSSDQNAGAMPPAGRRPKVGLKPATPQQAAGKRVEPPASVPSAASTHPAATAAADPPLDPPA